MLRDLRYEEYPPLAPTAGMLAEAEVPAALVSDPSTRSLVDSIARATAGMPTSWRLELMPSGQTHLGLSWVWAKTRGELPIRDVLLAVGLPVDVEPADLQDAYSQGVRVDLELGDECAIQAITRFYPAWSASEGGRRYLWTSAGWELYEVTSPFGTDIEDHRLDLITAPTAAVGGAGSSEVFEFALTLAVGASVGYGNGSTSLYVIGFDVHETEQLLRRVPSAGRLVASFEEVADQLVHRTLDIELRLDAKAREPRITAALWGVM